MYLTCLYFLSQLRGFTTRQEHTPPAPTQCHQPGGPEKVPLQGAPFKKHYHFPLPPSRGCQKISRLSEIEAGPTGPSLVQMSLWITGPRLLLLGLQLFGRQSGGVGKGTLAVAGETRRLCGAELKKGATLRDGWHR